MPAHGDETSADSGPRRPSLRSGIAWASNLVLAAYLGYNAYRALLAAGVWFPVRLAECLSAALLAVLVLFRSPAAAARWDVIAIVAVVVSNGHGFAFSEATPLSVTAETVGRAVMTVAALWGAASRVFLGRSFAILPALRRIRTGGPYRVVRHPIYLSLVFYDVGFVVVHPSWWNAAVATAGIVAHVARVVLEERLLAQEPAYRAYCRTTPRRLIPFVW
jgi:protein-S-isoprenylcysteine O-methyltransferase Ste14